MDGLCNFLRHFPIGGDINGVVLSQTLGGWRRDKMEEPWPWHIISLETCLSVSYYLICCDAGLILKITSLIFIKPFFFPFFLMVSFIIHFLCFRNELEMQVSSNTYMQTIWYLINICCNSSLQFIDSSDVIIHIMSMLLLYVLQARFLETFPADGRWAVTCR